MYRKSILALCLAFGVVAAGGVTAVRAESAETGPTAARAAANSDPPSDCKLPNRTFFSLGLPANWDTFVRPAGEIRAALLFRNYTAAKARDQYNRFRPAEPWWMTSSNGRFSLKLVPHFPPAVGDVRVPPKHGSRAAQSEAAWASVARSVDSVFDFSTIDVVIVADGGIARAPGTEFEPNFFLDGHQIKVGTVLGTDWPGQRSLLLSHELGHAISLPDEYAAGGDQHQFTGGWGLMGNLGGPSPDLFAYEKWHQEWLADNQVACVSTLNSGIEQTITPVETAGGTKAVVVRYSDTVAYVGEVRSSQGVDRPCSTGVLVYRIDSARASGTGPVRVMDSRPRSGGCAGHELNDGAYGVDQTFDDTANRVRIQVLSKAGENYIVRASLGTYPPTTVPPTTPVPTTPVPTTPVPTTSGPAGEVIFTDDFESATGWTVNSSGSDTATAGRFEVADPATTTFNGRTLQRGETPSGARNLVTGALAGPDAGTHDVDGGVTSVTSGEIGLGAGRYTLSLRYYLAHLNNATADDFLRITVGGTEVFRRVAGPSDVSAAWRDATVDLSAFAGQTIRITVEAADKGTPSLVEAAVDDVTVRRA